MIVKPVVKDLPTTFGQPRGLHTTITRRQWNSAARTYHILSTPTKVLCKSHRTLESVKDYENGVFTLSCGCTRHITARSQRGDR